MSRALDSVLTDCKWLVILAMSGGCASYANDVWIARVKPFSWRELCVELFISGFAGVIMFFICQAANVSPMAQAAAIGVAGHMGTRFMYALHGVLCSYLKCRRGNNE